MKANAVLLSQKYVKTGHTGYINFYSTGKEVCLMGEGIMFISKDSQLERGLYNNQLEKQDTPLCGIFNHYSEISLTKDLYQHYKGLIEDKQKDLLYKIPCILADGSITLSFSKGDFTVDKTLFSDMTGLLENPTCIPCQNGDRISHVIFIDNQTFMILLAGEL